MSRNKLHITIIYISKLASVLIVLLCLQNHILISGKVSVFGIDHSNYPILKANLIALNDNGKRLNNLNLSDIQLFENDSASAVIDLKCPSQLPIKQISSVLAVDISSSMDNHRLEIVREGINEWIALLPNNGSQTAITAFNHDSYILQDLTQNKDLLKNSIADLSTWGGTSYDAAFWGRNAGALNLLNNVSGKRVVVLLSDGESTGDEELIVSRALADNIQIFTIVIGMKSPDILKNISERTGGIAYEFIENKQQIIDIYRTIMMLAIEMTPCEITWKSKSCADEIELFLFADFASAGTRAKYQVDPSERANLSFSPSAYLDFGKMPKDSSSTKTIEITANNSSIGISDILPPAKHFTIIDYGGSAPPFVLQKDSSRTITISYLPKDTLYYVGEFQIFGDFCNKYSIICFGGTNDSLSQITQIRIWAPNGREKLKVNSIFPITWSGVSPYDSILIEYSGTAIWDTISRNANNLVYHWNVPDKPGNSYLLHIAQYSKDIDYSKMMQIKDGTEPIKSIDLSRDNKLAIGANPYIRARNFPSGSLIRTVANDQPNLITVEWDPSNTYIAQTGSNSSIIAWNYLISDDVHGFAIDSKTMSYARWSRNGVYLAGSTNNGDFALWNFPNKTPVSQFIANNSGISTFDISTNADIAAIAGNDGQLKLFDTNLGIEIKTIDNYSVHINSIAFDKDDKLLLVGLGSSEFELWDIAFGDMFFSQKNLKGGAIKKVRFSNNKTHFAALTSTTIYIYSLSPAKEVYHYSGETAINDFAWNFDGDQIVLAMNDGSIQSFKIKDIPFKRRLIQEDVSDGFWSIVKPAFIIKSLDYKQIELGNSLDSTISELAINQSSLAFAIDSITITGTNKSDFQVISPIPQNEIGVGKAMALEIRFSPISIGNKKATLNIYSSNYVFSSSLSGSATEPFLSLASSIYDFGKVNLGDSLTLRKNAISNNSNKIAIIDSMRIVGSYAYQFKIDTINIVKINALEELTLPITFIPSVYGRCSAILEIYSSSILLSPLRISLYGNAVAPELTLPDTLIVKTIVCLGKKISIPIDLHNTGNGYLLIKSIEILPQPNAGISFSNVPKSIDADSSNILILNYLANAYEMETYTISFNTNKNRNGLTNNDIILIVVADTNTIELSSSIIQFNPASEWQEEIKELTITNLSILPISFNFPIIYSDFELIEIEPNPIPALSTGIAKFKFKGGRADSAYIENAIIKDHCSKEFPILLNASIGAGKPIIQTSPNVEFQMNKCPELFISKKFLIRNTGSKPLIIFDISIEGENAHSFAMTNLSNLAIAPNSQEMIEISYFSKLKNNSSAKLIIKSNTGNDPNSETVTMLIPKANYFNFTYSLDTIDFGLLRENISKTLQMQIFNIGDLPMTWFAPIESKYFEILSIVPLKTNPNGSSVISLRFKSGISGNDYAEQVSLIDSCGGEYIFFAKAKVEGFADASLSIDSITAAPGQRISIPLNLDRIDSAALANIQRIDTQISFNSSLLYPVDNTPLGTIVGHRRILDISFDPKTLVDGIASELNFVATLGDTIETSLKINNSRAISTVPIVIEEHSGKFALDSVCQIDGARLIGFTGVFELLQNYPNPFGAITKIKFGTIEEGTHRLSLFNSLGQKLEILFEQDLKPGQYEYLLDGKLFPIGTYIYLLETPSESTTKKLQIIR